jgi:hypothetical protein
LSRRLRAQPPQEGPGNCPCSDDQNRTPLLDHQQAPPVSALWLAARTFGRSPSKARAVTERARRAAHTAAARQGVREAGRLVGGQVSPDDAPAWRPRGSHAGRHLSATDLGSCGPLPRHHLMAPRPAQGPQPRHLWASVLGDGADAPRPCGSAARERGHRHLDPQLFDTLQAPHLERGDPLPVTSTRLVDRCGLTRGRVAGFFSWPAPPGH